MDERMIETEKQFWSLMEKKMDADSCEKGVELICRRFGTVRENIGESLLGQKIPMLTVGSGENICLYVASHHGMESITSAVLLGWLWRLLEKREQGNFEPAMSDVCYRVIPMLNPDGVDLCIHGKEAPCLAGRQEAVMRLGQICPKGDFSAWQSNARGVDLNHNYDASFTAYKQLEKEQSITAGPTRYAGEYPESEPESGALAGLIRRAREHLSAVISLHSQGKEIYWTSNGFALPGGFERAMGFSRLCGYTLSEPSGMAAYGGLTDYLLTSLRLHALTVECGKGKNPLPMSDLPEILEELSPALTMAPLIYRKRR
ncbi:MAG: M14 family zinc carboxypeptidase [Eubacteriales bacterium]